MYIIIATIGKLTGGSAESAFDSIKRVYRPLALVLMLVGNSLFALALFYGFQVSSNAMTMAISIGIITTFIYSVFLLGVEITPAKIAGVILAVVAVYLLR